MTRMAGFGVVRRRTLGAAERIAPLPVRLGACVAWMLAASGCLISSLESHPDLSGNAEAAAARDTGCPPQNIRILFDDFYSGSLFGDHLLHLDVCGQFKVYRESPEPPHNYYDATEQLRAQLCAQERPVPQSSNFANGWAPERVVQDAAEDHRCPTSHVRIVGHGWNLHFIDQTFELDVCGKRRLYRKRIGWFGFYDATDEGPPLPCGTSAGAANG